MPVAVKNIVVALLGKNHTTHDQFEKIKEEFKEVEEAFRNYKHNLDISNREHLKSELFDLIQSSYHMLELLDVSDTDNEKHLKKMNRYINSGRIKN